MPTDIESILIYLIVLLALLFLTRGFWQKKKHRSSCDEDCGCDAVKIKRHPVIKKFIDRRDQ